MSKMNATGVLIAVAVGFVAYKVVTSKPARRYLLGLVITKSAELLKQRYG